MGTVHLQPPDGKQVQGYLGLGEAEHGADGPSPEGAHRNRPKAERGCLQQHVLGRVAHVDVDVHLPSVSVSFGGAFVDG